MNKAIENAKKSVKLRVMTQEQIEERNMDTNYEWIVVDGKIRQGRQLIPQIESK